MWTEGNEDVPEVLYPVKLETMELMLLQTNKHRWTI